MNKFFKAALFDLDGVVFDTEPQYTGFWSSQCQLYHPEVPNLAHLIKGQTLVEIYDKYFDDVKSEQPKITARLNEFEKNMHFDYVEGFEDYIRDLKDNGVMTAVVTSSNRIKMDNVYSQHPELLQLFDAILTSEDFDHSKPHPDCYLKGAQRLGADVSECIVYEDSLNGLKSGRAADMAVVGLATTNAPEKIIPLSDIVIRDYHSMNYKKTNDFLGDYLKNR